MPVIQKPQHSFRHYGRFILERYGKEAYIEWLKTIPQYDKPHECTIEACGQSERDARLEDLALAKDARDRISNGQKLCQTGANLI
jgi:hypothetical protein